MGCEAHKVFSFKVDIKQTDEQEGDWIGLDWIRSEWVRWKCVRVCLCLCHYLFCSWIRLPAMALCCHRHCRCRQLLLVVRCSSHPLTMPIVVVARINYFIVYSFFFVLFCAGCVVFRCVCVCVCAMCMCYRFVLICLVEATHAQNFYHSLQEWSSAIQQAHCKQKIGKTTTESRKRPRDTRQRPKWHTHTQCTAYIL